MSKIVDKPVKTKELTPKQQLFVNEYLVDLNATQAAIRAGFSEKTAREQGYRMFTNVHIQGAIQQGLKKKLSKPDNLSDRVISELTKIAMVDIKDYLKFDKDGVVLKNSDDVDGTMINEVSSTTIENETEQGTNRRVNLKFKLHDKQKALETLAKYLGLLKTDREDDSQSNVTNNINTIVFQVIKTPEQIEAEKRGGRVIEGE